MTEEVSDSADEQINHICQAVDGLLRLAVLRAADTATVQVDEHVRVTMQRGEKFTYSLAFRVEGLV